jgi:hypothetical protein
MVGHQGAPARTSHTEGQNHRGPKARVPALIGVLLILVEEEGRAAERGYDLYCDESLEKARQYWLFPQRLTC